MVDFSSRLSRPLSFLLRGESLLLHRGRQSGKTTFCKELASAARRAGLAVALCSLTTIIGYSSLLLSHNRALQSFGRLAVLGEVTCLVAALLALPALALRRRAAGDGDGQPAGADGERNAGRARHER